jgi:hypothetical protein
MIATHADQVAGLIVEHVRGAARHEPIEVSGRATCTRDADCPAP